MKWYYLSPEGERIAVAEKDLAVLVGSGTIHARTLVWRKGQEEWLSCGEVRPELFHPGHASLEGVDLGPAEVAGLVREAGLRPEGLRMLAVFLFALAGAMFVSLLLLPVCWLPALAALRYLKAADCLDSAGQTGELRAWQRYGVHVGAAGGWLRGVVVLVVVVILGAAAFGSAVRLGAMDLPEWLQPAGPSQVEVEGGEGS